MKYISLKPRRNTRISYNKLWKLLIYKDMNKVDLKKVSGISSATVAKLGKGENIKAEVLLRICIALKCAVCDIMEIVEDATKKQS